jgi:glycosyltransferase involved in cell wall biosynthesis
MLENRHLYAALPRFKRAAWESEMARDFVALALRACVWFVASERQRDFWSGILTASRVWLTGFSDPPPVFEIPNGVDEPDEIPHAELSREIRTLIAKLDETPGIQRIIVHGGMHSWIAYEPLVQTIANLTRRRMDVRLYLMGSKLPFGDEKPTSAASKFLSAASDAGIKEFIDWLPWLPYRERFEVLRRMNLGINLHPQGLETAISYRNRLLDFAAAEVPLLTSTGDVVSELMIEAGIALPIIGLDPKNIAPLIARALDARWGGNYHLACASFRSEWRWTKVLEPLERALKCALQTKSPFETYGSTPGGFFETVYCAIRSVFKKTLIR